MLGTALKLLAYARLPKATFAARHPVPAVKLKTMPYSMRHGYAPRLAALGAAAVALPLGIWIGRRMADYPARYREILARSGGAGSL